jgi:anti-sigma-K factor RskA
MTCDRVDELAAAYALGAVDADQERDIAAHLASCAQPHADAREQIDVAAGLPRSLDPVEPSPALRGRLMATIAATPQDHRATSPVSVTPQPIPVEAERRPWWRAAPLATALAAVALAAAVGLGAWGVSLNQQLAERDAALRAVASADTAYAVSGSAGSGWVIESDGQAIFLAESLAELPADQIYELWLIGPDEAPVAVGTVPQGDDVAVVTLERPLDDATTFAVTVESERVDAPTSDPVLIASLEG